MELITGLQRIKAFLLKFPRWFLGTVVVMLGSALVVYICTTLANDSPEMATRAALSIGFLLAVLIIWKLWEIFIIETKPFFTDIQRKIKQVNKFNIKGWQRIQIVVSVVWGFFALLNDISAIDDEDSFAVFVNALIDNGVIPILLIWLPNLIVMAYKWIKEGFKTDNKS